jgi:hypothetical protein
MEKVCMGLSFILKGGSESSGVCADTSTNISLFCLLPFQAYYVKSMQARLFFAVGL